MPSVRVRIAVAVAEDGDMVCSATPLAAWLDTSLGRAPVRIVHVTADIPLPQVTEVEGEVEADG